MKKVTFGNPEKSVPSRFCKSFNYFETPVNFDIKKIASKKTSKGFRIEFPLAANEAVFGFGLQLKSFNHKQHKLSLRVNSDPPSATGDSHAPVPFFVTTGGYGMYIDTARYITAYCGFSKKQFRSGLSDRGVAASIDELYNTDAADGSTAMVIDIPGADGVDIYIIEGETILDIVSQYNMLSGGGCDVPEWGLKTLYRAYSKYNENQISELVDYFDKQNIKCGTVGLEPGWQTGSYPCTYLWDEARFPNHNKMIASLKERGYHINLWEHAFISPESALYKDMQDLSGNYEVWHGLVPDFALTGARSRFSEYHKQYLVNHGIDGFKLDECDNSDFVSDWSFPECSEFPSGLDGEQYHSLFGILYAQTIMDALGEAPTLSEIRNIGALAASYPFVLYSDLYDHKDFIRGTVNSGFSGILWTPELRDASSKKELIRRLQTTVFSVHCLINAWYCPEVPWNEFDCEDEVRRLLDIRETLIPMLKQAFSEYKATGKPPVRALVADYTDDIETYNIDDEYIFCDKLIVAPLTAESDERQVYLPQGEWIDFYTKKPVPNGWFTVCTEEIPVFEKI